MRFLVILLFSFLINKSFAQYTENTQLKFKWLTVENGLSNNKVACISKCKEGFIWIGTDDGINRYDGNQFYYYHLYCGNRELDKWNQQVTSLLTDSKGNLWIGSYTLFRYNYELDSIEAFFEPENKTQPLRIRVIKEFENTLWIGARKGLYSIDLKTYKSTYYPITSGINFRDIWDLHVCKQNIWFVTENEGLYRFNKKTKEYTKVLVSNDKGKNVDKLLAVYCDSLENIWVGSKDDGLIKIDTRKNFKCETVILNPVSSRIRKIANDKNDNLWIGTVDGLYFKSNGSDKIDRIAHESHPFSQLSYNSIHTIYLDEFGKLWLGTYSGGVSYADLYQKKFVHYIPGKSPNFINSKYITGFITDKFNNLYVATDSSGINVLNSKTGLFSIIPMGKNEIIGKTIRCMVFDKNENLWIGTYQGGITCYNILNKTYTHITDKDSPNGKLQSNSVYSFSIDKHDNIWVGTNAGVDLINTKTNNISPIYSDPGIHYVLCDNYGDIWTGISDDGVFKYNPNTKTFEEFCPQYNIVSLTTLYRDSNDHLWVGEKSGLVCINLKNLDYKKFTRNDGLPNNTVQAILEDNKKTLWISTASGVVKCENIVNNPYNTIFKIYDKDDGMQGNYFIKNSAFKDSNGLIYFGGNNGFNVFNPDSIYDNKHTPQLCFINLQISNVSIKPNVPFGGKVLLTKTIGFTNQIHLSYTYKSIVFEFVALHFTNSENIKYKYRLYPLEKEWIETNHDGNFARYNSIPPGKYKLMVLASNSDNIWTQEPIELNVIVSPPFWQQFWFIALSLLSLVTIIVLVYKKMVANIQSQKLKLEFLVEARTRELHMKNLDLHLQRNQILSQSDELTRQKETLEETNIMKDKLFSIIAHDLKNPFNALIGFSDILKDKFALLSEDKKLRYIELINTSSKKIYNLLENLLFWARAQINQVPFMPENFEINELIQQNIKLLEADYWNKGITVQNNVPEPFNVFFDKNMMNVILRNLLTNAIKFSFDKGIIQINCKKDTKMVEFIISDNGIGMDEIQLKKIFRVGEIVRKTGTHGEEGSGLGLLLCKEFIEKHGGTIWAESNSIEGTSIHFTIPIKTK